LTNPLLRSPTYEYRAQSITRSKLSARKPGVQAEPDTCWGGQSSPRHLRLSFPKFHPPWIRIVRQNHRMIGDISRPPCTRDRKIPTVERRGIPGPDSSLASAGAANPRGPLRRPAEVMHPFFNDKSRQTDAPKRESRSARPPARPRLSNSAGREKIRSREGKSRKVRTYCYHSRRSSSHLGNSATTKPSL